MKEPAGWTVSHFQARGQCCRIRLRPAARIVCAVPRPQASATSKNRRTRSHPSRRDHARNHGGSEDEDFRSSAGERQRGQAIPDQSASPQPTPKITAPKIRGCVDRRRIEAIASNFVATRNRAVQWWHSRSLYVVVAERSAALISLPPFLSTNIVRLTGANGKTDDDLRPSLLLRGGTP